GMFGRRVHEAVVEADVNVSGATVHFVDHDYDDGAILGQWQVEVRSDDTPEQLAERVLRVEHRLYPAAVDHLCAALLEGRTPERMRAVRLDEPPAEVTDRPGRAPATATTPSNTNPNEDLG
ncbi:MAG: hypothetical protein KJO65_04705, partial [Gemmatimonadetes bacterium]|nr:hypothetical protein [Gemmatimonadota bacterium]